MLVAGLLTAVGMLFLLYKVGLKRVLAYDVIVDIVATIGLMYIFAGTYAGMMAAIVGGLFVVEALSVIIQVFYFKGSLTKRSARKSCNKIHKIHMQ